MFYSPTRRVENSICANNSGICESHAPCGLHVQPSESFEIDHVTSDSNIYGITIYGSGSGPNTVKASNFTGSVRLPSTTSPERSSTV